MHAVVETMVDGKGSPRQSRASSEERCVLQNKAIGTGLSDLLELPGHHMSTC